MPIALVRPEFRARAIAVFVAGFLLFAGTPLAAAGSEPSGDAGCNLELRNAFGPFDYRTATAEQRQIVEQHHFNSEVEALVRGMTGPVGGDIAYTLRVFPNHPRALLAMAKLGRKEGRDRPAGSTHSVDCWFQRAIAFQPEDGYVRLAYGVELLRRGNADSAIEQLKAAEQLRGPDANIAYNLGLAYFDVKDYGAAVEQAKRAYAMGFPLPGLRDKLRRAGKWSD